MTGLNITGSSRWRHAFLFLLLTVVNFARANVEKAIFLGPESVNVPLQKPTISDLNLATLSLRHTSARLELPRKFPDPSEEATKGETSWFLLDELTEGQRYEVRVCWSALEPTAFDLDVFELKEVWETPELIHSLAEYAFSRQQDGAVNPASSEEFGEKQSSLLFLRIVAAADYFTDDTRLMSDPPPVLVDLILDPFLFNILPQSLLRTVGFVAVVVVVSLLAARWIATSLQSTAGPKGTSKSKKRQ